MEQNDTLFSKDYSHCHFGDLSLWGLRAADVFLSLGPHSVFSANHTQKILPLTPPSHLRSQYVSGHSSQYLKSKAPTAVSKDNFILF